MVHPVFLSLCSLFLNCFSHPIPSAQSHPYLFPLLPASLSVSTPTRLQPPIITSLSSGSTHHLPVPVSPPSPPHSLIYTGHLPTTLSVLEQGRPETCTDILPTQMLIILLSSPNVFFAVVWVLHQQGHSCFIWNEAYIVCACLRLEMEAVNAWKLLPWSLGMGS